MKQEARSNLFVVTGTRFFFFPSFFPPAAAKIKRKERRGVKNENGERHKYEETLVKRSGDFNGGCLWGAENKSNIVALVVGQWTRVGIFSCVACKKTKNKYTIRSAPSDMLSVMVITSTVSRSFSSVFFPIALLFSGEHAGFINKRTRRGKK